MHDETVVLMVSGGLDSTTLCYWLCDKGYVVYPLFIDYGQHAARIELSCVNKVLPEHVKSHLHVIKLVGALKNSRSALVNERDLWNDEMSAEDLIVPYRNITLFSIAALYASSVGVQKVYSAFINSNFAKEADATQEYLTATARMVSSLHSIRLEMPFRDMEKSAVARIGIQLGAPIERTYSCQVNSRTHCGACPNCVDRITAFQSASSGEAR